MNVEGLDCYLQKVVLKEKRSTWWEDEKLVTSHLGNPSSLTSYSKARMDLLGVEALT
jgi:hypothetical protein